MENMEKISWRIWESEGFGKSLLIGGVLFYIPVVNLILLGYFGCWVRQLVLRKGMDIPEWNDGRAIFNEFLRVIAPFAFWVILPFALAWVLFWALYSLLDLFSLVIFAQTLAYLPVALVSLLAPPALVVSLIRLYRRNNLREALDAPEVLHVVLRKLRACVFPLLQFHGILLLGWPLLGFAAFLATLPMLAQLVLVFTKEEDGLKSGLH